MCRVISGKLRFKTIELDASTKKIKANRTKETQGVSYTGEPEKGKITM